ncbi:C-type mannose receptor 2 [Plakobranchus ocellatus]|uniref:C-type mannose receptor 2 n=1 Tax=Plakobranchus ocellatus TaxID=259542 RepID=A0AAV3YZP1_9GAST|nr:C-type mannose receptor 2 [Plakobranchus ocellatus]
MSICQQNGGDLLTIRDSDMAIFISTLLKDVSSLPFWIGLHNTGVLTEDDNRWRWLDENETASYTHWREGYPKTMNILQSLSEECAFVRHNWRINDAKWRNYFCLYNLMYICERPKFSSGKH